MSQHLNTPRFLTVPPGLGKLSAKIIHMILGFTAQPVPVQKPHALQLCPKGAQPLAAFRFYR